MDFQIKEESSNQSLDVVDVDSTTQSMTGLSFLEKYDRFKLTDNLETESPSESFPELNDNNCRSLLCTSLTDQNKKSSLSIGLPRQQHDTCRNQNLNKSELIEKLALARKRQELDDLNTLQTHYGDILNSIESNIKRLAHERTHEDFDKSHEIENSTARTGLANINLLTEKMISVRNAKERLYQVQQQVKDYIEQLELVERYKMESVG